MTFLANALCLKLHPCRMQLMKILSLLCPVVTEEILLEPLNSTALQGSNVRFNATVLGSWQVMTWNVRGFVVLTVLTASGGDTIPSSEQFSARFCSAGVTSCVEFTIHNVTRREAGSVTCTVQGNYTPKTAQLYVEGWIFIRLCFSFTLNRH